MSHTAIKEFMRSVDGPVTTAQVAAAIDEDSARVASAMGKMIRAGSVARVNGTGRTKALYALTGAPPKRPPAPRRAEFAELLSQDLSRAEITRRMGISDSAYKKQLRAVRADLGWQAQ